jgi:hypothetical protein
MSQLEGRCVILCTLEDVTHRSDSLERKVH